MGEGTRNPSPTLSFPPTFFGKKVGPPEAGASMGRADDIRPYRRRVKDAAPYNVPLSHKMSHNVWCLQTPQFAIH